MIRKYKMSDADLIGACSPIVSSMTRDINEFILFNIDMNKIDEYESRIQEFLSFEQDREYLSNIKSLTYYKNNLNPLLYESIRKLEIRFKLIWGNNSNDLNRLGVKYLTRNNEEKLLTAARNVYAIAVEYFAELQSTGYTQEMLDAFLLQINNFEKYIQDIRNMVVERANKKEERIIKGNQLYDLAMTYCEIGKSIFRDTNEAKYNDYIFYKKHVGTIGVPQNFRYNAGSAKFEWDRVSLAVSYRLEGSIDGENYEKIGSTRKLFFDFNVSESDFNFFRIRARNLQMASNYSTIEVK